MTDRRDCGARVAFKDSLEANLLVEDTRAGSIGPWV